LYAQENSHDPPTLTQQAYIIAKSLRSASYWLFALTISLLFFTLLAFISYIAFATESISNITVSSLVITIIIAAYIVGWFIIKARYEYSRIHVWNEDYLHSSYTLIFDTTIPKGNTTGERVLSLAKFVFPELRVDFLASIWDEPNAYAFVSSLVRKILGRTIRNAHDDALRKNFFMDSYVLDIVLKTKVGYFIVKDFGGKIVTFEDINHLITVCNKLKGKSPDKRIFRVVCVAEKYDKNFLDRESLEKLMDEKIHSDLKIDLLNKEASGYSVLWIS